VGTIILLAFGSCFFPTLLACVAIMLSRPEPQWLLIAFYLGGLLTSVATGIAVLTVFDNGDTVLGSTRSGPHPTFSIVTGLVALLLAWLMASAPGRSILDRWRSRRRRRRAKPERQDRPSWAERSLARASWRITFVIGAAIDLPGPLYLLALGKIANGDYSTVERLALILLFNVIMFLLLEVPLVGYLVRPEVTAKRVAATSAWLNANGLRITGWLVGLFGASLLGQGIAALVG
jgi:hypothetical protein